MTYVARKVFARATGRFLGWWWILVEGKDGRVWLRRVTVNEFGTFVIGDPWPTLGYRGIVEPNGSISHAQGMVRWKHFAGERGRQAFYVTHKMRSAAAGS